MRRKLSCFVIVCNEADRVEACLKSVASWVDQLVILDSGSTDGTFELCQRYSNEVFSTDWPDLVHSAIERLKNVGMTGCLTSMLMKK